MRRLLGFAFLFAAAAAMATAHDHDYDRRHDDRRDAPEISASEIGGALALVSGSLMVLRARRKR